MEICMRHLGLMLGAMLFYLAVPAAWAQLATEQSELTLEQRVIYQQAIEGVYWRHRIWPKENSGPKPSLDQVMPLSSIKAKVEDYLRKSEVLEVYWQWSIAAEQLQAEMDRMARQTKQPRLLRELWESLGNDPYVIAECLARPALANRLIRTWYEHDERDHGALKAPAEVELLSFGRVTQIRQEEPFDAWWKQAQSEVTLRALGRVHAYQLPDVAAGSWTGHPAGAPEPLERSGHTAVWTGGEMIVWGGRDDTNSGARYDPATDTWVATSTIDAPTARRNHTAVWTGSEMIVWGGLVGSAFTNTGGRYDPATDTWVATSTTDAPTARDAHTAVWSGIEMIVWGGWDGRPLNTGGRYDPATDTWIATSASNVPSERQRHAAVWTGDEMIVWGGGGLLTGGGVLNTGGRYDPATDTWVATSTTDAPSARTNHSGVWTGDEMIVWGGVIGGPNPTTNTGGRYDPATDTWVATSASNVPVPRFGHRAVWTGDEMIVWGGCITRTCFSSPNTGGRYDPVTDSWVTTSTTDAPTGRDAHTAVWTDDEMIVWGGCVRGNPPFCRDSNTGGRYDPIGDTWVATSTLAPDSHTTVDGQLR